MGTRANIIAKFSDGTFKRIYTHWDGYLSHNGVILLENYKTQKQVERLVSLGDISSLAAKCTKPKGHTFSKRVPGYTTYYGRDRAETWNTVKPSVHATLADAMGTDMEEYLYIWADGKWTVTEDLAVKPVDLAEAIRLDKQQ